MAARISRTTYPFWQTAPKIRLTTTSRLFAAHILSAGFIAGDQQRDISTR
jgi:hypothetical protein